VLEFVHKGLLALRCGAERRRSRVVLRYLASCVILVYAGRYGILQRVAVVRT